MWGVLHDGRRPYEGVLEAIQQLKRHGKTLIIISNSSKRYDSSVQNLQKLGFQPTDFAKVITSGEVSYQMLLSSETSSWAPLQSITKRRVLIFGSGDEDISYCVSCGWSPVYEIEQADLLLARGPFTLPIRSGGVLDGRCDGETEYQTALLEILQAAAKLQIPMIVSNPDKVRPDQDRSPMPGQIGDAYERLLNQQYPSLATSSLVKRIGKPFSDVYQVALQDLACDMSSVCMVGDALETDIVGGSRVGIDTIWVVNNGVHSIDVQSVNPDDLLATYNDVLQTFNANTTGTYAEGLIVRPDVVMPSFQW
jgi:HAD superfamily hydrolase (TIGR01459 family)